MSFLNSLLEEIRKRTIRQLDIEKKSLRVTRYKNGGYVTGVGGNPGLRLVL